MRPLLCLHGLYCCSSSCHGQYLFYQPGQYPEPPCPYHDQSRSPPNCPCYEHQYHDQDSHELTIVFVMINHHIILVMIIDIMIKIVTISSCHDQSPYHRCHDHRHYDQDTILKIVTILSCHDQSPGPHIIVVAHRWLVCATGQSTTEN